MSEVSLEPLCVKNPMVHKQKDTLICLVSQGCKQKKTILLCTLGLLGRTVVWRFFCADFLGVFPVTSDFS